ncbi:carbohydrate ABC transporter membrane protein 1 (CUT1 family) [Kribbella amoyensis]|uniref:Carbohydrate ABC transporter membrane protein 1 (CUT1 family) n=1 Tax=Kribbella amoyensis TaxID=996641 RepID=A0A561BJD8_9ACTN|nr:sugar ABC transporter permease [Kribbella amoyensis]TWD78976.1 carbohydrate ABC transporter membrane protein 1 (CUT1 family) [Kribbella amoyensis]
MSASTSLERPTVLAPPGTAPDRRRHRDGRAGVLGYWLVLPAATIYAVFTLWPIVQTAYLSFTDWNGLSPAKSFVAFDNYRELAGDRRFFSALLHNLEWVAGSWLAQGFGLLLAALLSASWIRARTFFRTVFFVPATMSLVVVGIAWNQIYRPDTGVLAATLEAAGLPSAGWLSDQHTAMPAVIATANWTYYGFAMVILLGGLQSIDRSLYEAAAVDGAGAVRQFVHITLPGIRNQITLLVVLSFINTLKTFDLVYIMTNGGPGRATEVVAYYIYSLAFVTHQVGYGAAAAVVLTLIILAITIVFLRLRERSER